ncbi:MAG: hypothetical protein IJ303_04435 [Clostridia bacterium]|nr:hypothetical protein [Clostridia bacterium]
MTQNCIGTNRFAPPQNINVTPISLMRDRTPCATSPIILSKENTSAGRIDFYSTPLGTMINAVFFALPFSGDGYEPCFIEIDGRRILSSSPCYRAKTSNLPPVFTKSGKGELSFFTDRFSAKEIIGRNISIRKNESTVATGCIKTVNVSDF